MAAQGWRALRVNPRELRLDVSLVNGQSFTWKTLESGKEWANIIQDYVVTLKQTDDDVLFKVFEGCNHNSSGLWEAAERAIRDYFQLEISLSNLYDEWSARDKQLASVAALLPGIRLLRQDPTENLFSFICSSNNNISRISSMVNTLRNRYGDYLCEDNGVVWKRFPRIATLARESIEQELRDEGFGYRAKFIFKTAQTLVNEHGDHADDWLRSLRDVPYEEARAQLLRLPGVGPKVADCVCLMSLGKTFVVPVDTHVWSIAQPYLPHLNGKTLTAKAYAEIGQFYHTLHGSYAGWAHSVLFSADLKKFENRVGPSPLKTERKNARIVSRKGRTGVKNAKKALKYEDKICPSISSSLPKKKKSNNTTKSKLQKALDHMDDIVIETDSTPSDRPTTTRRRANRT